jgi:hypothetical protein
LNTILRIPVTGGEAKLVVSLKNLPYIGTNGVWFGLDPTDAPLMLRDASTTDVYALTLAAAQAVRAFASFEPKPGLKFDKIYEVYSQRFQREDFGEDEKFDPNYAANPSTNSPKAA